MFELLFISLYTVNADFFFSENVLMRFHSIDTGSVFSYSFFLHKLIFGTHFVCKPR
jgi:hypothetical protein